MWTAIALYVAAVVVVVLLATGLKALVGHKTTKPVRETVKDAVPLKYVSLRR
jgi:hypothetical protein